MNVRTDHEPPLVLFPARLDESARALVTERLTGDRARVAFADLTDDPAELVSSAEVIVGWRTRVDQLREAANLRLFVTPAAGVQSLVPIFRALEDEGRSVPLANSHANAPLVAQHAVALLLAITNGVVAHDRWMRAGSWRGGDANLATTPVGGMTVGLLGYGAINRNVERVLSPFGCTFIKLRSAHKPAERLDFFGASSAVVAALPLTDATTGLVGRNELDALGPRGFLVNVARGAIVDEDELYEALAEGRLGAAALDVWYEYEPEPDSEGRRYPFHRPFHLLDNAVLSPHRAASPLSDARRWDELSRQIAVFLDTGEIDLVDLEAGY